MNNVISTRLALKKPNIVHAQMWSIKKQVEAIACHSQAMQASARTKQQE